MDFSTEQRAWLTHHTNNCRDRALIAIAVSAPIGRVTLSRFTVDDVWARGEVRCLFTCAHANKNGVPCKIRTGVCDGLRAIVREYLDASGGLRDAAPDAWLFPGPVNGHVSAGYPGQLLSALGLRGPVGSPTLQIEFATAVHCAHGRAITPELRAVDQWLWTLPEMVDATMLSMSRGQDSFERIAQLMGVTSTASAVEARRQ